MQQIDFAVATYYLSGPMSGIHNDNRAAFIALEKKILEQFPGATVLSPARHPRGLAYEQYMAYAKLDVEHCDILVQMDGWELSNGSQTERAVAVNLGKRITRAAHFL